MIVCTQRTCLILIVLMSLLMIGSGPIGSGSGEHGWCVYRTSVGPLALVHIAPRGEESDAKPASPGSATVARQLMISPEAIVSRGDRVYLVFPPAMLNDEPIRRISTLRAIPIGASAGWVFDPSSHMESVRSLPGTGTLHGVAFSNDKPHALMRDEDAWTLLRLDENGWNPVLIPEGESDARMLVGWKDSLLLITRTPGGNTIAMHADNDRWVPAPFEGLDQVWDSPFVVEHKGELIIASSSGSTHTIHALRSGSDLIIQTINDLPEQMGAVVLEGSDRLVLSSRADGRIRFVELDLVSGETLFDAAPENSTMMIADAIRMSMMMLIAMGSLIALLVIRPSMGGVYLLPDHRSLAEPSIRMVSMLIDLGVLSSILAPIFKVGIFELITGNVISRPDGGWVALPALLLVGMCVSTFMESIIGATPGKLVMRLRVVRAQEGPARSLPLHRALIRNLIKWMLPPVALLSIVDPGFRHRADIAAKSVVTSALAEPDTDEDGSDSD